MKHIQLLKTFLTCVALVLLMPMVIYAQYNDGDIFTAKTTEGVEMKFKVISAADKTCQVGVSSYSKAIPTATSGHVTIPKTAEGYTVTRIEDWAFGDCYSLTGITIPNSVIIIGKFAFADCVRLTSITIPNSVKTIENAAFYECKKLTSISIPSSVENIVGNICYSCTGLTSIVVDKNNMKYDSRNNCNAIIETETNTLITGCNKTIIPSSVTKIGDDAFNGAGLTDITIPNSVTTIGESAFVNCQNLTSISIPSSVEYIGRIAFHYTAWYNNQPDGLIYINNIAYAYKGTMPENTSITIKDGTTFICEAAFSGCTGLTSITIPNSVESIEQWVFSDCTNLINISIPNSVKTIGYEAFSGCSALTSLTIPNSVTRIDDFAFKNCTDLINISIPTSVEYIGKYAFQNTAWYENQPDGLIYINNIVYAYKGTMPENTSITIKDGTTVICDLAFYKNTELTSITIPNSVTNIGSYAFYGCSGLTSVISEIEEPFAVDESTFSSSGTSSTNFVPSTATLYVPNGTKEKYEATAGWIFKEIIEMDKRFQDGDVFTAQTVEGVDMTFKVLSIDEGTCQVGTGDSFSTAIPKSTTGVVTIPYKINGLIVTNIEKRAFKGCAGLIGVRFDGMDNEECALSCIGEGAFYGCSGLTSAVIPASVTSIEDYAFYGCDNLGEVVTKASEPMPISESTFSNRSKVTLYVPTGCKAAYMAADYWKEFKKIVEIEVTDIYPLTDAIYADATMGHKGGEALITVNMKNAVAATSYSFDMLLPEGVTLATDKLGDFICELSDRHGSPLVTLNHEEATGAYHFSVQSKAMEAGDGAIWTLWLKIADEVETGDYAVKIQNAQYVPSSGDTPISMPETISLLTIFKNGDVNGDDKVDVEDVVGIVNKILGEPAANFNEAAADVNGDGKIDVEDVVATVNIILGE